MSIEAANKRDERTVTPNFITDIIDEDLAAGRVQEVVTRFPPEPNGYAHLGHAVASFINFGVAGDYGGLCNLRFDDTNPVSERMEFAEALERDFRWLGWSWDNRLFFASDYFEQLYGFALRLIEEGKAYVDSLSEEEIQDYRGTVTGRGARVRIGSVRWRRTSSYSKGCEEVTSPKAHTSCGLKSTWRTLT